MQINHPIEFIIPQPPHVPLSFIERLITFYDNQIQAELQTSYIWNSVLEQFHKKLDTALKSKDAQQVHEVLSVFYQDMSVFGIDVGSNIIWSNVVEDYKNQWATIATKTATSFGIIPAPHPKITDYVLNFEDAVAGMEKELECSLSRNGGGGMAGVKCGDRFITFKLLDAACVLNSMRKMLANVASPQILEIGAGVGTLCLLTRKSLPAFHYHTIDLPTTSVIQAYLLAYDFPPESIWLAGEPQNENQWIHLHGILPSDIRDSLQFCVAVNQDSLPEMLPEVIDGYVNFIQSHLIIDAAFLSINQETCLSGQSRVFDAMKKATAMKLLYRCPYWCRDGYIEEVWRKR